MASMTTTPATTSARAAAGGRRAVARVCFTTARPAVCRAMRGAANAAAVAGEEQRQQAQQQLGSSGSSGAGDLALARRSVLAGLALAPLLAQPDLAHAEGYATFLGMATPPTSYGGYGGNANETPKYSFEYPANWKAEVPSKVEKGTQGIDGRVVNPRGKDQRAFVITLGRAGEDNKSFVLTDLDSTFAGFAGADYDLQDALSDATNTTRSQAERNGVKFYEYDIESPAYRYLSSIAVKDGKVFALFVRSPTRAFGPVEADLRHIVSTFTLL